MTTAIKPAKVRTMDMKLEVIVISVSDVERSKQFYGASAGGSMPTLRSMTASV